MMDKNEIIERLERLARCAVHTVGELPFVMSLDDGIAIHEAIDMLRSHPEPHWIQCSERLPDTDRNVFIARGTPESMTVCVGHYRHDYDQWYEDRNWFAKCLYDGLYWCEMPSLPEPYKEDEQG